MGKKALPTLPPAFGALFEGVAAAITTLSTLDSEAVDGAAPPHSLQWAAPETVFVA